MVSIHFPHSQSSSLSSPRRGRWGPLSRLDSKPWWALPADSPHRLPLCLRLPTSPQPAWSESVTLRLYVQFLPLERAFLSIPASLSPEQPSGSVFNITVCVCECTSLSGFGWKSDICLITEYL